MNTDRNNILASQLVYALGLMLITFLFSSCGTQSAQELPNRNIRDTQKASNTITPQTNSNNQKVAGCKSDEELQNFKPLPERSESELNKAILQRNIEVVRKLLRQKADPNEAGNFGNTPLLNALAALALTEPSLVPPGQKPPAFVLRRIQRERQAQIPMVQELLKYGADANLRGYLGTTPLIEAARSYPANTVKISTLLIQHGADVNLQDELGDSALMDATRIGNIEAVKFLIARGADVELTNCKGETALSIAQDKKNFDVVRVLQNVK